MTSPSVIPGVLDGKHNVGAIDWRGGGSNSTVVLHIRSDGSVGGRGFAVFRGLELTYRHRSTHARSGIATEMR